MTHDEAADDVDQPEDRGYRDPEKVLGGLRLALVVCGVTTVLDVGAKMARLVAFPPGSVPDALTHMLLVFHIPIMLLDLVAWLTLTAAFAWWARSVVVNSRTMFVGGTNIKLWSGLWLAVPIAHLWMPYSLMRSLWRLTHRQRGPKAPRRPAIASSPLIRAWSATLIGSLGWVYVGAVLASALRHLGIGALATIELGVGALGVLQLLLMYRVAAEISGAQAQQRRDYREVPERLPPRRA